MIPGIDSPGLVACIHEVSDICVRGDGKLGQVLHVRAHQRVLSYTQIPFVLGVEQISYSFTIDLHVTDLKINQQWNERSHQVPKTNITKKQIWINLKHYNVKNSIKASYFAILLIFNGSSAAIFILFQNFHLISMLHQIFNNTAVAFNFLNLKKKYSISLGLWSSILRINKRQTTGITDTKVWYSPQLSRRAPLYCSPHWFSQIDPHRAEGQRMKVISSSYQYVEQWNREGSGNLLDYIPLQISTLG